MAEVASHAAQVTPGSTSSTVVAQPQKMQGIVQQSVCSAVMYRPDGRDGERVELLLAFRVPLKPSSSEGLHAAMQKTAATTSRSQDYYVPSNRAKSPMLIVKSLTAEGEQPFGSSYLTFAPEHVGGLAFDGACLKAASRGAASEAKEVVFCCADTTDAAAADAWETHAYTCASAFHEYWAAVAAKMNRQAAGDKASKSETASPAAVPAVAAEPAYTALPVAQRGRSSTVSSCTSSSRDSESGDEKEGHVGEGAAAIGGSAAAALPLTAARAASASASPSATNLFGFGTSASSVNMQHQQHKHGVLRSTSKQEREGLSRREYKRRLREGRMEPITHDNAAKPRSQRVEAMMQRGFPPRAQAGWEPQHHYQHQMPQQAYGVHAGGLGAYHGHGGDGGDGSGTGSASSSVASPTAGAPPPPPPPAGGALQMGTLPPAPPSSFHYGYGPMPRHHGVGHWQQLQGGGAPRQWQQRQRTPSFAPRPDHFDHDSRSQHSQQQQQPYGIRVSEAPAHAAASEPAAAVVASPVSAAAEAANAALDQQPAATAAAAVLPSSMQSRTTTPGPAPVPVSGQVMMVPLHQAMQQMQLQYPQQPMQNVMVSVPVSQFSAMYMQQMMMAQQQQQAGMMMAMPQQQMYMMPQQQQVPTTAADQQLMAAMQAAIATATATASGDVHEQ